MREAGGDPFERVALGKMLLNLKQMAGRLIRSESDRGIVVVVEGRTSKGYFRKLASALPPGVAMHKARRSDLRALLAEIGL